MQDFIGTWKLLSCEFRTSDGDVSYPFGEEVGGLIIYTEEGYVSATVMNPNRPCFESGKQTQGTPEEIKTAFEGYVAYFGTFEVDREEGIVYHHVQGSLLPNWIGEPQKRFFEFEGARLTLSTPPIPFGDGEVIGALCWERIE